MTDDRPAAQDGFQAGVAFAEKLLTEGSTPSMAIGALQATAGLDHQTAIEAVDEALTRWVDAPHTVRKGRLLRLALDGYREALASYKYEEALGFLRVIESI